MKKNKSKTQQAQKNQQVLKPNSAPKNLKNPQAKEALLSRAALNFTNWAERWFPDAFIFGAVAVLFVAACAFINGAPLITIAKSFGEGFWSISTFTLQLSMLIISGYVFATSPPIRYGLEKLAKIPKTAKGAIGLIVLTTMVISMVNWAMSLILGGFLVRACARRTDIKLDYRAAGAAAYLSIGTIWAMGITAGAAQIQANRAILPDAIFNITGIIPLTETIFLWQSLITAFIIIMLGLVIAVNSVPSINKTKTASDLGIDLTEPSKIRPEIKSATKTEKRRPGDYLEYSPFLSLALVTLGTLWIIQEAMTKGGLALISSLDSYNFIFLMLGLLLHFRPVNFLSALMKAVPTIGGVLIQFPLYGGIAVILTSAANADGLTLSGQIAHFFISFNTPSTFPVVMGIYSTMLGFFIPSGAGKWFVVGPHVMQSAAELKLNAGWAVQSFSAPAMSNLINPFFMAPLMGVLGLKARDIVGYTFLQFIWHTPLTLLLFWALAKTF